MADLPRLSPAVESDGGRTTPLFVFDAPSTPLTDRETSPRPASTSPKLPLHSPKASSSQPTSPKLSSAKATYSQPTSPKLTNSKTSENSTLKSPTQSAGSATGNPRNKCALQPGHSLMDWIRYGNSGRDLTGVGGRPRAVSPKDLAQHNTTGDAWLAIRGRVYNVTHYLPYHPGGPDELMRGAGADATQLFDKVHPWVNYESLLSKCLVGPLRTDQVEASEFFGEVNALPTPSKSSDRLQPSKAQELVRKSMENLANCITPVRKRISNKSSDSESVKSSDSMVNTSKIMQSLIHSSELPVNISRRAAAGSSPVRELTPDTTRVEVTVVFTPQLRFDWIQTSTRLTLSVYTHALSNPGASARLRGDGSLALHVACGDARATLCLIPEHPLRHPLRLRVFPESGKVEVCARKADSSVWRGAGKTRWERDEATVSVACAARRACRVRSRKQLTHDTVLLQLEPLSLETPQVAEAAHVPIGYHIKVHHNISGMDVVRSYTPVGEHWGDDLESSVEPEEQHVSPHLCLVVKCYSDGALTPTLTALHAGDTVTISGPYGNFALHRLRKTRRAYLLAAGTGLTPLLSLLKFLLSRRNPRCDLVQLMFFNKKEDDIILRDKLSALASYDERVIYTNVLSEAGEAWRGERGRVCAETLRRWLPPDVLLCGEECEREHFAAACGPPDFTLLTQKLLLERGLSPSCFHAFLG